MKSKGTRYTPSEIDKLSQIYSEGVSIYKICKVLNRSDTSVKNHLKKLGIFVPNEVPQFIGEELNFRWLYWVIIPLFILIPKLNPLELILYEVSK